MNKTVLSEAKTTAPPRRTARRFEIASIAPFAALALLAVLGAIVNPRFLGYENLTNVFSNWVRQCQTCRTQISCR